MTASIIIPLYNKERYIQRALDSVLVQTFGDFELLVIDDGSTDDGGEIIGCCSDSRVRMIRQENAGPGAARNRGLRESRGEIVAFLDADDEWLPEYLGRAVAYLQSHLHVASISMGYRDAGRSDDMVQAMWDARGIRSRQYMAGQEGFSPQFAAHLLAYMCPPSTVARKAVLLRYGGYFDQRKCLYGEDAYLWLQVLVNETIAVSREELVIIHSEASELSQDRETPFPTPPDLRDAAALFECCPPDRHGLLEQVLAIRAVTSSIDHSMNGYGREARRLLSQFCRRHHPAKYAEAKLYSLTAPLLPFLRQCRRKVRRALGKGR